MGIVRAHKEETYGHTQEVFLGWSELLAVVHLLPHVKIVVGSRIELERDASNPMEHQVGPEHVREVGEKPGGVTLDAGDDAVENLESDDENNVDHPGSCIARFDQHKDPGDEAARILVERVLANIPFAFTQFALRFGMAD